MKKKFYCTLWFWIFFVGAILLLGNVLVLYLVPSDSKSGWLTLISGWVSGVATFLVGLIAHKQNKEFAKIEKTNTLLNQIVNFTSEYEIGYVGYFKIEKIIDLIYKIRDCSLEESSRAKDSRAIDLEDEIIFFLRDQDRFEALLQKSFYGSQDIILLHQQVIKLGEKLNSIEIANVSKNYGAEYFDDQCTENIKFIREWMSQTDHIAQQVLLDYQSLRSEILNKGDIDRINARIIEEERVITEYFAEHTKKEQTNNG